MIKIKDLIKECENCGRDWNNGQDHEGSMAQNEIKGAISNASKIQNIMGENDNLPGWISSYITLAADYLHSVAEYMEGQTPEMNQQPGPGYELEEKAHSRAQQAAIAIAMQKAGKQPKG